MKKLMLISLILILLGSCTTTNPAMWTRNTHPHATVQPKGGDCGTGKYSK
jgi:hypothetical protein